MKQGWEPLCTFLGHEIPDNPLPRENMKGELFEKYSQTDFIKNVIRTSAINIFLILLLIIFIGYIIFTFIPHNFVTRNIYDPFVTHMTHIMTHITYKMV